MNCFSGASLRRAVLLAATVFSLSLIVSRQASAATFYFSASDGDDARTAEEAQNPGTPWKSISKLNSIFGTLKPGDTLLFKRGDVFSGTVLVVRSGSAEAPISLGAYGIGANPKISGLSKLAGWTLYKDKIFSAELKVPSVNMVLVDGKVRAMGRYPNSGYLKYEAHSNNSSITDKELPDSPSWVGAEIVIRKVRWILDRHKVLEHSGGTLKYESANTYGNNKAYQPVDGNGYFIQNHIETLDTPGEWSYDPAAGKLFMHFGDADPGTAQVLVSTQDANVVANSVSYINFSQLDFEGGNTQGLVLNGSKHINISNCNVRHQGGNGIQGLHLSHINITGGSISDCLNNGIKFELEATHCRISRVNISNSAMIPGASRSGDGAGQAVHIVGGNIEISRNRVINSGYNAINFAGSNVLVEKNVVQHFCSVKDDGAGIYTYTGGKGGETNRIVRHNIVLNGIGALDGAEAYNYELFGKAAGIYLDEQSEGLEVSHNTVAHGPWGGIFLHKARNLSISDNVVFDFAYQLHFCYTDASLRNVTRTGNHFVALTEKQYTFFNQSYINESAALTGNSDKNIFAKPIDEKKSMNLMIDRICNDFISLEEWQTKFGHDKASTRSPKPIAKADEVRFEVNDTAEEKVISLEQTYVGVDGKDYSSEVTLAPFSSIILIRR